MSNGRATPDRVEWFEQPTALMHQCPHMQIGHAMNATCSVCGPLRAYQDRQIHCSWKATRS